jgi:hypothetical protein
MATTVEIGFTASGPVAQLCYAYNFTKRLKENEDISLVKQEYPEAVEFCKRIINDVNPRTVNSYSEIIDHFKDSTHTFDYEWFPSTGELVRHLSFQEDAVGLIIVETIDSQIARSIGIIGHESSSQKYILVDPFAGVAFQGNNLDRDVQKYLSELNVPRTTGYTYCAINPIPAPAPTPAPVVHEADVESSVGDSSAAPEPVRKKRPNIRRKLAEPILEIK